MLVRHEPLPSSLPPQPRVAAILSCGENLMALSWHMPISRQPFRYAVAVREENFTHALLRQQGTFALNFLSFVYYREIDQCGRLHGNETDKLTTTGLVSRNCDPEGNRILDASDYVYECRIIDTYKNGDHTMFIADVTALHLNDSFNRHSTLFLGRGQYATPSAFSQVEPS